MKKKLDAYRGTLTAAQVAAGINAANANARRLAADAATLLQSGSCPSAASLAILSIEEAGKASILREISVARSEDEVRDSWKNYRSHTRKNVAWLLPQLAATGARKLEDFHLLFEDQAEHPYLLDQLKQLGFYTDCLGQAHWSVPSDIITPELANSIVRIAGALARDTPCTPKEIELWVEHVGPVWKKDLSWMKQALVNWYQAMQAAGLKPEGENAMEEFIHGQVGAPPDRLNESGI